MTTKNVTSIDQLLKELNKMTLSVMKDIAKSGEKNLKDHVQSEIYDANIPSRHGYKRTRQLKQSVTKDVYQIGNFTTAAIFHDYKSMESIAPSYDNNRMGQHHSTVAKYDPQEYNFFLPATINDGTSGKIFGEGYWTKPRPYFTHAKEDIERTFQKSLKYGLQYRGLTIK